MTRKIMPGFLPVDQDQRPLQVASRVQFHDGSPEPLTSPLELYHDAGDDNWVLFRTIKIPESAVGFVVKPMGMPVRVGLTVEDVVDNGVRYWEIAANESEAFDCAGVQEFVVYDFDDYQNSIQFQFIMV